jgi:hypothetical protein
LPTMMPSVSPFRSIGYPNPATCDGWPERV